ncbi:MAG: histidine kinase, partial [Mariprofundaceae bacterium]
ISKRDEQARVWAYWLHDDIGQKLTAIGAMAHVLGRQALDEQGQATLNDIREINKALMSDVRERLNDLSPSYVEEIGLSDALRQRIGGWFLASYMRVDLQIDEAVEALPDARKRAVMEALVDVQKRIEEACPLSESLDVRCSIGNRLRLNIVLGGERMAEAAEQLALTFCSGATYALLLERLRSHGGKLRVHASSMGSVGIALSWPVDAEQARAP